MLINFILPNSPLTIPYLSQLLIEKIFESCSVIQKLIILMKIPLCGFSHKLHVVFLFQQSASVL